MPPSSRARSPRAASPTWTRRAAETAPGVLAVLTHRNAPKIKAPPAENPRSTGKQSPANDLMLQDDRVHFFGQYIAMVIADTLDRARQAAALVQVRYEPDAP